jgi:peptidoglycan-N-acetylglucosamine deacetylase
LTKRVKLEKWGSLSTAQAEDCPGNPGALGTSRVIAIDPIKHRRLGLMQYRETLPLQDHEVVLTFDDGPVPPYTSKVLDALSAECVKANFFVVGEMARAYPALVQREYREGHTIGTHTAHHRFLTHLSIEGATKEIEDGIASVRMALGSPSALAPFFRRYTYLYQRTCTWWRRPSQAPSRHRREQDRCRSSTG